jgi:hypothetical protein
MSWGGNTRLRRVTCMLSFEQAKKRYEGIKPIRGRSDDIRPLSDRSAVDQYSIRKRGVGDEVRYEAVLYATPVLTYHQNGDIVINMGGYPTPTTRAFIYEILGLPCGVEGGTNYISLGKQYVVMQKDKPTVLRRDDNNGNPKWELVESAAVTEVQLKRKAANAVRKRYKSFTDYVKNMAKLRGEEVQRLGMNGAEQTTAVKVDYAELEGHLDGTPAWELDWMQFNKKKSIDYKEMASTFFGLIAPREGEADPADFYTAFLLLVASTYNVRYWGMHKQGTLNVSAKLLLENLKELLYKYHSDEVFERIELPIGKLPCKKYESWV